MHHNMLNTDINQGLGIASGAGKCCFRKIHMDVMKMIPFSSLREEKGSLQINAPVE